MPAHGAAVLRQEKTDAIIRAVFSELAERGWAGVTVDAVAQRAGVGKPAIYRRWRSRDQMLIECVITSGVDAALPADTGNLRDDLLGFTQQAAELLADPFVGRVISAVLSATGSDPALAALLADRFRAPRRRATAAAFERATRRGEITGDTDVELATDLLAGPFYMYALGVAGAVPAGYPQRVVEAIIRGCCTRP